MDPTEARDCFRDDALQMFDASLLTEYAGFAFVVEGSVVVVAKGQDRVDLDLVRSFPQFTTHLASFVVAAEDGAEFGYADLAFAPLVVEDEQGAGVTAGIIRLVIHAPASSVRVLIW